MRAHATPIIICITNVFNFCLFENKFLHENLIKDFLYQWTWSKRLFLISRFLFNWEGKNTYDKFIYLCFSEIIEFITFGFISSNSISIVTLSNFHLPNNIVKRYDLEKISRTSSIKETNKSDTIKIGNIAN